MHDAWWPIDRRWYSFAFNAEREDKPLLLWVCRLSCHKLLTGIVKVSIVWPSKRTSCYFLVPWGFAASAVGGKTENRILMVLIVAAIDYNRLGRWMNKSESESESEPAGKRSTIAWAWLFRAFFIAYVIDSFNLTDPGETSNHDRTAGHITSLLK
jgi:hypothetical protein